MIKTSRKSDYSSENKVINMNFANKTVNLASKKDQSKNPSQERSQNHRSFPSKNNPNKSIIKSSKLEKSMEKDKKAVIPSSNHKYITKTINLSSNKSLNQQVSGKSLIKSGERTPKNNSITPKKDIAINNKKFFATTTISSSVIVQNVQSEKKKNITPFNKKISKERNDLEISTDETDVIIIFFIFIL